MSCTNNTPSWFVGHWRDWHRGHGCNLDDGRPRNEIAQVEIDQHAANANTGYLTDAELAFLRASTSSGNTLLVRALDELKRRREICPKCGATSGNDWSQCGGSCPMPDSPHHKAALFDHSARTTKHFEPLLGFCICKYCMTLPDHASDEASP